MFLNAKYIKKIAIFGLAIMVLPPFIRGEVKKYKIYRDIHTIKNTDFTQDPDSSFTVVSINAQNKYQSGDGNGTSVILDLVNNNIDYIGTQETKMNTVKQLKEQIPEKYQIVGEPRWGNGVFGHLVSFANETNSIIADNNILMDSTYQLAWLPQTKYEWTQGTKKGSIMSRVATCGVTFQTGIGYIRFINTHLDYGVDSIQKRQMEEILTIYDKEQNRISLPTVITGDFNAKPESDNMIYFTEQLKERGILIAPINEPTYKGNYKNGKMIEAPKQVDYIAYSKELKLLDAEVIDNPTSDHNQLQAVFTLK